jgi:ABC-type Fe3+/spermidine/putrescine transport system ATPase subunit
MSDTEQQSEADLQGELSAAEVIAHDHGNEQQEGIINVSGLTKIYPDGTLAVDDINFSVSAGDFAVIIGPSGCGKSTTLHSLVGKVEPTEGTVTLGGEDITRMETYDRDIGLVFQDFQLFPHLTAEENVRYGLERMDLSPSEIDRRVDDIVETLRLSDIRGRDPMELSAGQKQRVALARSLVLEPRLLLLDEPLGDMDYKLQKHMETELLRIHREFDTTFVYVTHDQTQAMRLADQIVVMNDGKVEQSASVNEVYNHPATAFVATFVGDSNIFRGTVERISDDGTVAHIETDIGQFAASTENLDSAPAHVVDTDISFSVRPQHLSLDDNGDNSDNSLDCYVEDVIGHASKGKQVILSPVADESREIQLRSRDLVSDLAGETKINWRSADTTILERNSVVGDIDLEKEILGE